MIRPTTFSATTNVDGRVKHGHDVAHDAVLARDDVGSSHRFLHFLKRNAALFREQLPIDRPAVRRVILSLGFALITACAVSFSVVPSAAPRIKSEQSVFILPPSDGYGMADCIAKGAECGRIVANAWCESKGYAKAAAYSVVSATEITGSVGGRGATANEPPVMISCAD